MINWAQIDSLISDVGEEDVAEVIEIFLDEVDQKLDDMRGIAPKSEPQDMAADLHFLKGSALNIGFEEMGQFCSKAENQFKSGSGDPQGVVQAIAVLFEQSRSVLETRIRI
jgi:HPt (histidine-containing phosphotransfer) domain-containing protein